LDKESNVLYVAEAYKKGRGVFTNKFIFSGTLVEQAPVLVVPENQEEVMMNTVLSGYLYHGWDGNRMALAFGMGSMFNHSYTPNVVFNYNVEKNQIDYYSWTDIRPGDELVINYNGAPEDKTPVWFEVS
jgi:hypothetical protein